MFLLNILLALSWMALNGAFSFENFVVGFILGFLILWFTQNSQVQARIIRRVRWEARPNYFRKVPQVILFVGFFLWELVKANLRVAYEIVTPGFKMRPGVVGIPLDITSEIEIFLLANLITLTPGTLSLDVSTDRKTLYVHALHIDDIDQFRQGIKNGFEKRVRELIR